MNKEDITGVTLEGWCIIIDTLCGGPSLWTVQESPESSIVPETWGSKEEAQKALIIDYIEHLQSYIDGDREYDETDTGGPEGYVGTCRIENGELIVHNEEGDLIIDMEIETWRKNL